jgi:hypothetical protein
MKEACQGKARPRAAQLDASDEFSRCLLPVRAGLRDGVEVAIWPQNSKLKETNPGEFQPK